MSVLASPPDRAVEAVPLSQTPRPSAAASRSGKVVLSETATAAVRSGAVWGIVFGGYVALQALAYVKTYPTKAARDAMQRAYGSNVGLNALIGSAHSINTVGGYVAWRCVGALGLLGGVWAVLTSTRLLRGNEEAGRSELLAAGRVSRPGVTRQALVGLGFGYLALLVVTGVLTVGVGALHGVHLSPARSAYFAFVVTSSAGTFLAVGALTSQLADTRRLAATLAGGAFGVAYALRMVADTSSSLHWLLWVTPLGWIEASRPLVDPRPITLLPVLGLTVVCAGATWSLASLRDLDTALFTTQGGRPARLRLLGSPLGLTVRQVRPAAIAWLVGTVGFALLLGSVSSVSTSDRTGSRELREMIERLGGHGTLAEAYLGLTFLFVSFLLCLMAAGQVTASRREESDGHLELLVARPFGRVHWLVERLAVAAALVVLDGVLAGACAWIGVEAQHGRAGLAALVAAGINVAAPSLLLLGIGALVFGLVPRVTTVVVYGYVTWSFLLVLTGGLVHIDHWVMDTSAFFHVAPAPATPVDWGGVGGMVGVGLLATVAGSVALRHRDLAGE